MNRMAAVTKTQLKVFLREPISVFFGLVFPSLLLIVIGMVFPGATDPSPELGNKSLVALYEPVCIALGLATVALSILPAALGGDREKGILRRFSTTPVHPRAMVAAHLAVQLSVVTCASLAAILVGKLVFDIPFPRSPGWFVVSYGLGAVSLLAVGLLIGALVRTASAGQGMGMLLYFPLLFFAGVYIPLEVMPAGVRAISTYTPSGAAVRAMSAAWSGGAPESSSLVAMAVCAVVTGLLAIRLFRWD
jgi:ABC-2 type transport system permease protein